MTSDKKFLFRSSPHEVESIIDQLVQSKPHRAAILKIFYESINYVHRVAPAAWGVTVDPNYIRINVGRGEGITLLKGSVRFLVTGRLFKLIRNRGNATLTIGEKYKFIKDALTYEIDVADLKYFHLFQEAHFDAIERAAHNRKINFWPDSYSSGLVKLLQQENYSVVDPDYSVVNSSENIDSASLTEMLDIDESQFVTMEGRRVLRLHLKIERSGQLPKKKLNEVLKQMGKLACEVCEFDFEKTYGATGSGFAEVHHLTALSSKLGASSTRLQDLAIVCSNCHRMLHKGNPIFSIDDLKRKMRSSKRF